MENLENEVTEPSFPMNKSDGRFLPLPDVTNEDAIKNDSQVLYDADVVQRLKFEVDDEYETTHIYSPLEDEKFFEFDGNSRLKIVDDGKSLLPDNAKASIKLFDFLVSDIENDWEGEKPANWKDEIDADKEKIPSVAYFLTVTAFAETRKSWLQTDNVTFTEAFFNSKITQQKHFLRKKTIEDIREFNRFKKIPLASKSKGLAQSETTVNSNGRGKAALYDKMKIKDAEGYAGRVPAWHKVAVIDFIFASGLTQKK